MALARKLRAVVKAGHGEQEMLWTELLRRLEQSLAPLTTADAARVIKKERSLNGIDAVNQAACRLRREVLKASRTLTPNPGARLSLQTYAIQVAEDPPLGWKQDVGPSIGLLLADAADEFVGGLIRGVTEVCDRHAYDLLVDVSKDDPIIEVKKLQRLLERTHGVLIVPVSDATLDPAVRHILHGHDYVFVDRYLRDLPDVPSVHHDDISAGRQAGILLKQSGCTRVLIVDQASRSPNNFAITPLEDRAKGCKMQLQDQALVRHLPAAGSDEQGGFDALRQFEQKSGLTTTDGIFALTDRLALG